MKPLSPPVRHLVPPVGGLVRLLFLGLGLAAVRPPLAAQSSLGHSPNIRASWTLGAGHGAFLINHRFELMSGGDALLNVPTLSVGFGLPARLALGLDFTSNSEIVADRLGGNETQFWLGRPVLRTRPADLDLLVAYNTAARSVDAALTARLRVGPLTLLGEGRAFQDALGTDDGGTAGAVGAVIRLTPHLEVSGDAGGLFSLDTVSTVWSAGVAIAIPGTPHTLSLHATNGGAVTLQGASRPKVLGSESVRFGFVFTAPLGSLRQWAGIFRRGAQPGDTVRGTVVEMRAVAFTPREIRIQAGDTVTWINRDPLVHTVTGEDGAWDSGPLEEGGRFQKAFDRPGRYPYHCTPHPQMTAVVIVEPRAATDYPVSSQKRRSRLAETRRR